MKRRARRAVCEVENARERKRGKPSAPSTPESVATSAAQSRSGTASLGEEYVGTSFKDASRDDSLLSSSVECTPKTGPLDKRSDMAQTDVLNMPALGRPFQLGMMYDQRSDKLIPSISLWDSEDLKKDLMSRPMPKTEFVVLTEDRIENKTFALDIDGSLKMSFLGGLINVGGSAKYLDDRKQSNQIARVTLKYESTTRFEQLSMSHLGRGNVKHQNVFYDNTATHVVVGLVYGAKAFFIFDRDIHDNETHKDVHGTLNVLVKSIPSFSIKGQASLTLTEDEKTKADKMHCMFRGDFLLERNPTTFQEAVEIYHKLPNMLGENHEKAVPVEVWLYPLSKLDSNAAMLVREISAGLVNQTGDLFEEFQVAERTCNDLRGSNVYGHFPDVKKSITQFHSHLQTYILTFKKDLLHILPQIRGGGMEEQRLAELLRSNKSGPFSNDCMTKWLNGKRRETKILETYLDVMQDTKFVTEPGAMDSMVAREDDIICFHFHLNSSDDQQLAAMKEKLDPGSTKRLQHRDDNKSDAVDEFDDLDLYDDGPTDVRQPWFEISRTRREMREAAHTFRDYKKVNTDVCFIVSTEDDEAKESGCSIEVYKDGKQIERNFRPPSRPSTPATSEVTFDSITLTWAKPSYGAEFIKRYKIFYKLASDGTNWTCLETTSAEEMFTVPKLQPSSRYIFKIQGKCQVGCSPPSEPSDPIETEYKKQTLAEVMIEDKNTKLISMQPNIYKLPLHLESKEVGTKVRHFTMGTAPRTRLQNKVLMIVGATGAGKSTLLNGIVNFLLNVKWSDPYRFKVVTPEDEETEHAGNQAFSQTENITAYTFYHHREMPVPYNLHIIDTPGYGDFRGIKRDKQITKQIKAFFVDYNIVDHLDAVCFVTPAPGRLTPTQKYVIDSILSIYGKNMRENIAFLVTFADAQRPPVLDSIEEANISYTAYYKFNNSALFVNNDETTHASVDNLFWDMGIKSMQEFFKSVDTLEPKSLKLTKEVLRQRATMEATIQGIQPQVRSAILDMNNLEKEKDLLQKFENQIADNKMYKYTVPEEVSVKIDLEPGTHVTNCLTCNTTCHYPCTRSNDEDKMKCKVMNKGLCTVCPKHCPWDEHHNMKYRFKTKTKIVEKIYSETLKQYEVACTGKEGQQQLIHKMERKYGQLKKRLLSLVQKVKNCLVKLREIALRPNPLSTTEYIDILIESERLEADRGWEERCKHLEEVRQEAELIEKIQAGTGIV